MDSGVRIQKLKTKTGLACCVLRASLVVVVVVGGGAFRACLMSGSWDELLLRSRRPRAALGARAAVLPPP
jgi:hypothetical protein